MSRVELASEWERGSKERDEVFGRVNEVMRKSPIELAVKIGRRALGIETDEPEELEAVLDATNNGTRIGIAPAAHGDAVWGDIIKDLRHYVAQTELLAAKREDPSDEKRIAELCRKRGAVTLYLIVLSNLDDQARTEIEAQLQNEAQTSKSQQPLAA
jgi:hypothetical protein